MGVLPKQCGRIDVMAKTRGVGHSRERDLAKIQTLSAAAVKAWVSIDVRAPSCRRRGSCRPNTLRFHMLNGRVVGQGLSE